jgi:hypothetical protein
MPIPSRCGRALGSGGDGDGVAGVPAERGHTPETDHRVDGNGLKVTEELKHLLRLRSFCPVEHADESLLGP